MQVKVKRIERGMCLVQSADGARDRWYPRAAFKAVPYAGEYNNLRWDR